MPGDSLHAGTPWAAAPPTGAVKRACSTEGRWLHLLQRRGSAATASLMPSVLALNHPPRLPQATGRPTTKPLISNEPDFTSLLEVRACPALLWPAKPRHTACDALPARVRPARLPPTPARPHALPR